MKTPPDRSRDRENSPSTKPGAIQLVRTVFTASRRLTSSTVTTVCVRSWESVPIIVTKAPTT